MTITNNTNLTEGQIADLPELGSYHNDWRQRQVTLYRLRKDVVISIGTFDDGSQVVICEEPDSAHAPALHAWSQGRSYRAK